MRLEPRAIAALPSPLRVTSGPKVGRPARDLLRGHPPSQLGRTSQIPQGPLNQEGASRYQGWPLCVSPRHLQDGFIHFAGGIDMSPNQATSSNRRRAAAT